MDFESKGCTFESCWARHFPTRLLRLLTTFALAAGLAGCEVGNAVHEERQRLLQMESTISELIDAKSAFLETIEAQSEEIASIQMKLSTVVPWIVREDDGPAARFAAVCERCRIRYERGPKAFSLRMEGSAGALKAALARMSEQGLEPPLSRLKLTKDGFVLEAGQSIGASVTSTPTPAAPAFEVSAPDDFILAWMTREERERVQAKVVELQALSRRLEARKTAINRQDKLSSWLAAMKESQRRRVAYAVARDLVATVARLELETLEDGRIRVELPRSSLRRARKALAKHGEAQLEGTALVLTPQPS